MTISHDLQQSPHRATSYSISHSKPKGVCLIFWKGIVFYVFRSASWFPLLKSITTLNLFFKKKPVRWRVEKNLSIFDIQLLCSDFIWRILRKLGAKVGDLLFGQGLIKSNRRLAKVRYSSCILPSVWTAAMHALSAIAEEWRILTHPCGSQLD